MSNVTNTSEVDYAVGVWYQTNLLDVAMPALVANQFGMKAQIPEGRSKTVRWGRYEELDEATTPLTEGVEPDGQVMQVTRMDATCEQYGDLVLMTDVLMLTLEDDIAQQANIRLGQQMARTFDTLTFDVLAATASIYSCASGQNTKTPTEISQEDLDAMVQLLMDANGEFFSDIYGGVNKIGTAPLDEAYMAIGHTKLYRDLKECSSWVPVAQYPNPAIKNNGERGYTDHCRWHLTTQAPVDTSGVDDIYSFFMFAQNAYGVVDIENGNIESIFTPPGGPGDRLRQLSSLGWKGWHAAKIVQDQWALRGRATLGA